MRGSSINFKPSKRGALKHNDRTEENEVEYLLLRKFRLNNEFDLSAVEADRKIRNLLVEANENTLKTIGQELQAKSYLWEAVINLTSGHTLKDLKKTVKKLEKLTGFTSVQAAIHRDEGREGKDQNGNHVVLYNYHAHVTFFTLDRNSGLQLYRRDISKPLRKEYRKKVEAYRSVHKRLIPPYHLNKIMKLKKKPKWSEANILEINKEIRQRFKKDGHIVYDRERLSFLQTVVAEELNMPRGTVSVEAEAKRLGVTLEPNPKVRKEHKQYKDFMRLEERIINKTRKAIEDLESNINMEALSKQEVSKVTKKVIDLLLDQVKKDSVEKKSYKASINNLMEKNEEVIQEKDKEIHELKEQLQEPKKDNEKQIDKQQKTIVELEDKLEKADKRLSKKIAIYEAKITRAKERIEGRNRLYDDLLEKFINKEKTIEEQNIQIEDLHNENQELKTQVEIKDSEVEDESVPRQILEDVTKTKDIEGENEFTNIDSSIDNQVNDETTNENDPKP